MDGVFAIPWFLVLIWLLCGVYALNIHHNRGTKSSHSQLLGIVLLGPISFLSSQFREKLGWVFVGLLVVTGILFILFTWGQGAKLICTRSRAGAPVNCIKQPILFGAVQWGEEEILGVQGATLGRCESCEEGGSRVELLTAQGNIPLNPVYTTNIWPFSTMQDTANRINDFVRDTHTNELAITDAGMLTIRNCLLSLPFILGPFAWNRLSSGRRG
jgi:hypothetical protein